MSATFKDCRFCLAAYPILADDELHHSLDPRMGDLARAFAVKYQGTDTPSDEQIGWFCHDADAVIGDFPESTTEWEFTDFDDSPTDPDDPDEPWGGVEYAFNLNGVPYILQVSEWEPSHPVKRETYLEWIA